MSLPLRFRAVLATALFMVTALAPGLQAQTIKDQALIELMQERSKELQSQILQSEDPAESLKLQKQLVALLEETAAKVSPPMRVMLLLGMRVGQPLMQHSQAYMAAADQFMNSPQADMTAMTTLAQIEVARDSIAKLQSMNEELLEMINELPENAKAEIDKQGDIPEDEKAAFLEGFLTPLNRRIGPMRAMRTLESRTYVEFDKMLGLMAEHWGKWSVGDSEEGLIWEDPEVEAEFVAAYEEIEELYSRQMKAAEVMQERL